MSEKQFELLRALADAVIELRNEVRSLKTHVKELETKKEGYPTTAGGWNALATKLVNQDLSGQTAESVAEIAKLAMSGGHFPADSTHPAGGTDGKMAAWLNANIPTVCPQEIVENALAESQVIAKQRMKALRNEADGTWDGLVNNMTAQQLKALQGSLDRANPEGFKND
jgi:hypothetical protein